MNWSAAGMPHAGVKCWSTWTWTAATMAARAGSGTTVEALMTAIVSMTTPSSLMHAHGQELRHDRHQDRDEDRHDQADDPLVSIPREDGVRVTSGYLVARCLQGPDCHAGVALHAIQPFALLPEQGHCFHARERQGGLLVQALLEPVGLD